MLKTLLLLLQKIISTWSIVPFRYQHLKVLKCYLMLTQNERTENTLVDVPSPQFIAPKGLSCSLFYLNYCILIGNLVMKNTANAEVHKNYSSSFHWKLQKQRKPNWSFVKIQTKVKVFSYKVHLLVCIKYFRGELLHCVSAVMIPRLRVKHS